MSVASSAYYDYCVRLMDTDTEFREVLKTGAYGEPYPADAEKMTVDDDNDERRFRLEGVCFGKKLNKEDLVALMDEFFETCSSVISVSVEDNGKYGNGLFLSFLPTTREGNCETHPEKWGDNISNDNPSPLFGIRLTPRQAEVLGTALIGVAKMRVAQED